MNNTCDRLLNALVLASPGVISHRLLEKGLKIKTSTLRRYVFEEKITTIYTKVGYKYQSKRVKHV